jgi:hypothetical protein
VRYLSSEGRSFIGAVAEIPWIVEELFTNRFGETHVFVAEYVDLECFDNSLASALIILATAARVREV